MATSAPRTRVERATDADRAAWDGFVAARPEGDVLQLWAWGEVMAGAGEPPARIVVRATDGRLRGVAQALVRSTAFGRTVLYVPHGPLWERDAPDAETVLGSLLGGLRDLGRAVRGIVVKVDPRGRPVGDGTDSDTIAAGLRAAGLRPARFDLQARMTNMVTIEADPHARMAGWSADARNLVRRGAREGTIVDMHRDADRESVQTFTDLLRKAGGGTRFRIHPPGFYIALAEALAPFGGWFLAIARFEGRPVAAVVVTRVADRAYYVYGASDHDAPRQAYGSYAAMATVFEALAIDGVRTFDLWGVADPNDPKADPSWTGFSAFKRHFGGADFRHPGAFDLVVDPLWWRLRDLRERTVRR